MVKRYISLRSLNKCNNVGKDAYATLCGVITDNASHLLFSRSDSHCYVMRWIILVNSVWLTHSRFECDCTDALPLPLQKRNNKVICKHTIVVRLFWCHSHRDTEYNDLLKSKLNYIAGLINNISHFVNWLDQLCWRPGPVFRSESDSRTQTQGRGDAS